MICFYCDANSDSVFPAIEPHLYTYQTLQAFNIIKDRRYFAVASLHLRVEISLASNVVWGHFIVGVKS